jgi:ABC-type lipoprotein export system ATPase subunit
MIIHLQQVLPTPLKERLALRKSDVWNNQTSFEQQHLTKLRAPSGSGKTTLIHILYQLRADYEGTVLYNDKATEKIDVEELSIIRQQQLSIVFQDLRLFPQLTAYENIELKRIMQKPYYPAEKIDELAETLGVTHVLHRACKTLSYGEQQRIAIIRALIQPFSILLMDEPFSHLDIDNTKKAAELILKECNQREAGFVLTDLDDDDHFPYTQKMNL